MSRAIFLVVKAALALLALLVAGANAGDWYVDSAHGDDANDGATPGTAWRTIVHAGSTAPAGSFNTVHLAPGTYFESAILFQGQNLVGDGGAKMTIIDGGGTAESVLKSFKNDVTTTSSTFALVRGVTLRNAGAGITISTQYGDITTAIENVVVEHTTHGVYAAALATAGTSLSSDVHLRVSNVDSSDCNQALWLWVRGVSHVYADISDSEFRTALTQGVELDSQPGGVMSANFVRCRMRNNASDAVRIFSEGGGNVHVTLTNCGLTQSGAGLNVFESVGDGGTRDVRFQDSTIAGNGGASVSSLGGTTFGLRGTLIWGNGTDVPSGGVVDSSFNWIGGADPLFVDSSHGDYRLQSTSPCIDAGDPTSSASALDLNGHPRPIDGDLDTHERNDIGAYEFAPLGIRVNAVPGGAARLSITAPTSGTALVYFVRTGVSAPVAGNYGEFDLGAASSLLFSRSVTGGVTSILQRPVPDNPALIGQTLSFQALLPSSAAPLGSAWSNAVQITIGL